MLEQWDRKIASVYGGMGVGGEKVKEEIKTGVRRAKEERRVTARRLKSLADKAEVRHQSGQVCRQTKE
jgi:hypothetical protein